MTHSLAVIKEINPERNDRWEAKIIVFEKHSPRTIAKSGRSFQRYVLLDTEGTKVQATIWGTHINMFQNRLKLFKSYYISNVTVKNSPAQFRMPETYLYEWVIHAKTLLEDCPDDDIDLVAAAFNFTPFSSFPDLERSVSPINIIGIITEMRPPHTVNNENGSSMVQEGVIVDQENQPYLISFWDHLVENECSHLYAERNNHPVVVVMRVRVTSFNGTSLSTRGTSMLMLSPPIPQTAHLRTWYDSTQQKDTQRLNATQFLSASNLPCPKDDSLLKTINDGLLAQINATFWIKGTIRIDDEKHNFLYNGCSKCRRVTASEIGNIFFCNHCRTAQAVSTIWFYMTTQILDDTGALPAQIFGQVAAYLFGYPETKLIKEAIAKNELFLHSLFESCAQKTWYIQVKSMRSPTNPLEKRYCVFKVKAFEVAVNQEEPSLKKLKNSEISPEEDAEVVAEKVAHGEADEINLTPPNIVVLDNSEKTVMTAQPEGKAALVLLKKSLRIKKATTGSSSVPSDHETLSSFKTRSNNKNA